MRLPGIEGDVDTLGQGEVPYVRIYVRNPSARCWQERQVEAACNRVRAAPVKSAGVGAFHSENLRSSQPKAPQRR